MRRKTVIPTTGRSARTLSSRAKRVFSFLRVRSQTAGHSPEPPHNPGALADADSLVLRLWRGRDRPGWRNFGIAMLVAFAGACCRAFFRRRGADKAASGSPQSPPSSRSAWPAGSASPSSRSSRDAPACAGSLSGGLPPHARRHRLSRRRFHPDSRRREHRQQFALHDAGVLLAGILISGVLSRAVLTGIELKFDLPEHIFAEQPVLAELELRNEKQMWPSFSLRVIGDNKKGTTQILTRPVFFPYIPRLGCARQKVELTFPASRRLPAGCLRHPHALPFRLLRKNAPGGFRTCEIVVYPQRRADRPILRSPAAAERRNGQLFSRTRPRTAFPARISAHRQRPHSWIGKSLPAPAT